MAKSIETLQMRIENTLKNIKKLEAKKVRIQLELDGVKDTYGYDERDMYYTNKEIVELNQKYVQYTVELNLELEKQNAPKIQPIVEFLNEWKERAYKFYDEQCREFAILRKRQYEETVAYQYGHTREEKREIEMKHRQERSAYSNKVQELTNHKKQCAYSVELNKMLDREVKARYEDFVKRISKVVGEIEDTSHLFMGNNGAINGFVKGTQGSANVESILAGGYNIQCLHYRVLVKEIKGTK